MIEYEHPTVTNLVTWGTPDGKAVVEPLCPVCGDPCEIVYRDGAGEIVGCDECLTRIDAWDCPECTGGGTL